MPARNLQGACFLLFFHGHEKFSNSESACHFFSCDLWSYIKWRHWHIQQDFSLHPSVTGLRFGNAKTKDWPLVLWIYKTSGVHRKNSVSLQGWSWCEQSQKDVTFWTQWFERVCHVRFAREGENDGCCQDFSPFLGCIHEQFCEEMHTVLPWPTGRGLLFEYWIPFPQNSYFLCDPSNVQTQLMERKQTVSLF